MMSGSETLTEKRGPTVQSAVSQTQNAFFKMIRTSYQLKYKKLGTKEKEKRERVDF